MIVRRLPYWPMAESRGPFSALEEMRREMMRLVDELTEPSSRQAIAGVFPLLNVTEDRDNYYVRAELPGVKAEDLEISITGNSLSIAGERKIATQSEGARYHRRERESGTFSRMVSMPAQIDPAKVEARSKDGILTVILPKSEAAKPRQISVKSS